MIPSFVARTFFLDKAIDHRSARFAQTAGLSLSLLWILLLVGHFIAYRKVSLLLLGLVTLALGIILWRIAFLMLASYHRWKL
ncbi:MAG TPA: hypothetical protein VGR38_05835 [Candidatus Polarisedimenticolia bacterium]|nr:hypothetical protein [Candidatus Polarisedimenticolia bacterium]